MNRLLIISSVLLMSINAYSECNNINKFYVEKTQKLISLIEEFGADESSKFLQYAIEVAQEDLYNGVFCGDGTVLGMSRAIFVRTNFCLGLNAAASFTISGENKIRAKDQKNQRKLEEALYNYGLLFDSSKEKEYGAVCDLKTLNYTFLH